MSLAIAWPIYFVCTFGLTSLAWMDPASFDSIIDPAVVPSAVLIAAVALFSWTVGYLVGPPKLLVRASARMLGWGMSGHRWSLRSPSIPLLVYGVGLASRLLRLANERLGYLQDPVQALDSPSTLSQATALLGEFGRYGLILAAIQAVRTSSLRNRATLSVLFVAELLSGVLLANKKPVLLTLAAVGAVYLVGRRKLPWKSVIATLAIVLLLFGFTPIYRSTIRTSPGGVSPDRAIAGFSETMRQTLQSDPGEFTSTAWRHLHSRLRQIDNVALVMHKTPSTIDYEPWTALVYGPITGLVPRALWPNKPVLSIGREFSIVYYELPPHLYTSSAITTPGDLYRHGGVLMVIVGMALIGIISALFDRTLRSVTDLRGLLIFLPVAAIVIQSESSFTALLVELVHALVFLVPLTHFAFSERSGSGTNSSGLSREHPVHTEQVANSRDREDGLEVVN